MTIWKATHQWKFIGTDTIYKTATSYFKIRNFIYDSSGRNVCPWFVCDVLCNRCFGHAKFLFYLKLVFFFFNRIYINILKTIIYLIFFKYFIGLIRMGYQTIALPMTDAEKVCFTKKIIHEGWWNERVRMWFFLFKLYCKVFIHANDAALYASH